MHAGSFGDFVLAHDDGHHRAGNHHQPGDREEGCTPAHGRHRPGQRRGREQRSERADAELDADQGAEFFRRIALRIERQRRHQIAAAAHAHQDARGNQHAGTGAGRKQHRAGRDNAGANQHADFRAVTVEADAEWNLRGREGEKEGAGQKPDLGRRHGEFAREFRRDDADGIPEKLADDINAAKRGDENDRRA